MPYLQDDPRRLTQQLLRFGQELRRCRIQAGRSQMSLAEASGVAQSTISRLERGLAPHAAMIKLVALGAALDRRLPLAFCPHEHACVWERLDADGMPVRTLHGLDLGMWLPAHERVRSSPSLEPGAREHADRASARSDTGTSRDLGAATPSGVGYAGGPSRVVNAASGGRANHPGDGGDVPDDDGDDLDDGPALHDGADTDAGDDRYHWEEVDDWEASDDWDAAIPLA